MPITCQHLLIPEVRVLRLAKFEDERGFFVESFRQQHADTFLDGTTFVQDNLSHSVWAGTVRGLHYQLPPHGQAKLIQVIQGSIFDVAVDIRKESPTYGKHVSYELHAETMEQLFIPDGFAHGFMTLVNNTVVSYKTSNYYNKEAERGILWNDPTLRIPWPKPSGEVKLSPKDHSNPALKMHLMQSV